MLWLKGLYVSVVLASTCPPSNLLDQVWLSNSKAISGSLLNFRKYYSFDFQIETQSDGIGRNQIGQSAFVKQLCLSFSDFGWQLAINYRNSIFPVFTRHLVNLISKFIQGFGTKRNDAVSWLQVVL